MDQHLNMGLIHLDVAHKRSEENREALTAYAEEAARRGARIILAPELAVSGYSFDGRDDVASQVEVLHGATFQTLAPVAARHGVFICAGIAERDPVTDIFYNTALVIGPDGRLAAFHRKLVSERKWACPGSPSASGIFETPWGRLGVLICADTYYGLLPRSMAVQGADALLVLANWPPSGLDPRNLWRARSLENGMGIIACNRTGVDRRMDCRECRSFAVTPTGEVLLDEAADTSRVWVFPYPLEDGKLPARHRRQILSSRRPRDFSDLYLHVNGLEDFSALWGLPAAGPLTIRCVVPESGSFGEADSLLQAAVEHREHDSPVLLMLPHALDTDAFHRVQKQLQGKALAVVTTGSRGNGAGPAPAPVFLDESRKLELPPDAPWVTVDFGPSRLALVAPRAVEHPETAVALSKIGCDVLAATGVESLDPNARLRLGVKSLERIVVTAAAPDGALICEPPVGHSPWKEASVIGPGTCAATLDTNSLRRKFFQDRVDMDVLLNLAHHETASSQ